MPPTVLLLDVADVLPERSAVLGALGVPDDASPRPHLEALAAAALAAFADAAAPAAVTADVAREEFARVYAAAPANAPDSVVGDLFPRAGAFTLFVATVGSAVSDAIAGAFSAGDYAMGAALDATASQAADRAAAVVEASVQERLRAEGRLAADGVALRYSPGYCGWDVGGQAELFRRAGPEAIGVHLTPAGFMKPEKSVSGVVLAGPASLHRFSPTYPFCAHCRTRTCVERMRGLFGRAPRAPVAGGGA